MIDAKDHSKKQIVIIGHLLSVGGTTMDPIATFAQCNSDGEPCEGAVVPKISIPLDNDIQARRLGGMLYTNFSITLQQCTDEDP